MFNGSKLSRKRFYVIDQNGYIVHTHRNDRVVGKFIGLLEPCAVRLMTEEGIIQLSVVPRFTGAGPFDLP